MHDHHVSRFTDGLQLTSMLYGGDYNPEQWRNATGELDATILAEDMRLMREAGVNIATVGVFSWSSVQPDEHTWTFAWLDQVLDALHANGVRVCLATGTAAQPAWLSAAYPDVLPVNAWKQRHDHGNRMNFCPTSPDFRRLARQLAQTLAERFGDHPALLLWHVSNEYGPTCYCERCAARFREWLRARYGTLEALNQRWITAFWGHTYTDWEQIQSPTLLGEQNIQALLVDYRRFMSDMNLECFQHEADVLRAITPRIPVTTNFHGLTKSIDYATWAPFQDVIAWDSYPRYNAPPSHAAFFQDLMRGLGAGKPWLLMEQAPNQVQWQAHNPLKRPGVMRLQSYQAIAHGSNAAMFFQWRQSRGSGEMYHGAMVTHAGHGNTRVFKEIAALGAELRGLDAALLAARSPARVALLWSWPNWWIVENPNTPSPSLSYIAEQQYFYRALWNQHVTVDVISPDAPLDGYDLVVAPLFNSVTQAQAQAIEQFVARGGTFVTTFFSGVVDEHQRAWPGGYPGPLRNTLGIWVEAFDPLPPESSNTLIIHQTIAGWSGAAACDTWCDIVQLEGARALATFGSDFYAGSPAITEHRVGDGRAVYIATRPEADFLDTFFADLLGQLGIAPILEVPAGVEVSERRTADVRYTFVLNHTAAAQHISLPQPMRDLLTQQVYTGAFALPIHGVSVLITVSN